MDWLWLLGLVPWAGMVVGVHRFRAAREHREEPFKRPPGLTDADLMFFRACYGDLPLPEWLKDPDPNGAIAIGKDAYAVSPGFPSNYCPPCRGYGYVDMHGKVRATGILTGIKYPCTNCGGSGRIKTRAELPQIKPERQSGRKDFSGLPRIESLVQPPVPTTGHIEISDTGMAKVAMTSWEHPCTTCGGGGNDDGYGRACEDCRGDGMRRYGFGNTYPRTMSDAEIYAAAHRNLQEKAMQTFGLPGVSLKKA